MTCFPTGLVETTDVVIGCMLPSECALCRLATNFFVHCSAPCRHAEFARAIVKRKLSGKVPDVSYFGVIKDTQKDVVSSIEEDVYNAWDSSSAAPAKTRVRDAAATPTLDTLSWVNGSPKFPDALIAKVAEGSPQYKEIVKFKEQLIGMFPETATSSSTAVTVRATGLPDFSGENVLDLEREVSLETFSADEFNQEELLGFRGCGCRFLLCGHVFFFGCVMIFGDIAIAVDLIAAAAAVVIAVVAVIVIAF